MQTQLPQVATRKWNARWIWSAADPNEKNVYYYFRKTFDSPQELGTAQVFIAADTRYQLFLNGTFVGRGAPQSQPFFQYYDTYNLEPFMKEGTNCIAVVVNHVGNLPDTRGGLLLELVDDQNTPLVCSDDTWSVERANAWKQKTYFYHGNKTTPYQEFFDARKEPDGWKLAAFDDHWSRAVSLDAPPPCAGPWTKLVERDIPFMTADPALPANIYHMEESLDLDNRSRPSDLAPGLSMVGQPITFSSVKDAENLCDEDGVTIVQGSLNHLDLDFDGIYAPAVVLDFGRIITARSRIHLSGPAGGMLDIGYAERLIDGRFNIAMECEFADRYTLKDGEQVFESFTWKSFRYLKIRFRHCFDPVTVHTVHGVISTYPYEERGRFLSSDTTLNAVFDISKETVRLCSNEFLMDTPWREQAQWLGDVALVTVPAIHSCFGDTALARKFLMQAGQNQHPTGMISNISNTVNHHWVGSIPDYSLWWIKGLLEQYLYTGDDTLLHRLYPQALRILDANLDYLNADGLIENMPYWVFIDWANVETRGICTAYNGIFYIALGCLQQLATFRGDAYIVELTEQIQTKMKSVFHETLFDERRGCYSDACIDGVLSEMISEQANMTAVAAGLCDPAITDSLIATVFQNEGALRFTEAQPFYMAVVLSALDATGHFDLGLDLIRQRWGKRMVDKGATSVFEEWYQNGSWRSGDFQGFLRSHSHAWSAIPADFLIRNVIGLEVLEPGCSKLTVAPKELNIDYNIVFPTPLGPITINRSGGKTEIDSPESITVLSESA